MISQDLLMLYLQSFSQLGGEPTTISSNANNFIYAKYLENGLSEDSGILKGMLYNLNLNYGMSVLFSNCIEYGCIEETGIWTTALVTDVSRFINGETQYFVRGPIDESGNVYIMDVGYLYPNCFEFRSLEENIPVYSDSSFQSNLELPSFPKFIKLKRVNEYRLETILHYLPLNGIPRTNTSNLLTLNQTDQVLDLEDYAISVINLLSSNYYIKEDNWIFYRDKFYVDPYVKYIIESTNVVSNLIDVNADSPRYGSIPYNITSYLTTYLQYDTTVDDRYLDRSIRILSWGCVDDDCVGVNYDNTLIFRDVRSRSIAWLLITYCKLMEKTNDDNYLKIINLLSTYLINQINNLTGLVRYGWTHDSIYLNSQPVEIYDLSTSVMTSIALMYSYNTTLNLNHLDIAVDIYQSIMKYLYNDKDKLFTSSLNTDNQTYESLTYSLIFATHYGRSDLIETILDFMQLNVNTLTNEAYFVKDSITNDVISSNLYKVVVENNESDIITYLHTYDPIESYSSNEVIKLNLLLYDTLSNLLLLNYNIPYIYLIDQLHLSLHQNIKNNGSLLNLVYISKTFSSINIIEAISTYEILDTILFARSNYLSRMKSNLPIDFEWFNLTILNSNSFIGSILRSLSKVIAPLISYQIVLPDLASIQYAKNHHLDRIANDLLIYRRPNESDDHLKDRMLSRLWSNYMTRESIINLASQIEFYIEDIYETFNSILIFNSTDNYLGNPIPDTSVVSGSQCASTHIISILARQIISQDMIDYIKPLIPSTRKVIYKETLDFTIMDELTLPYCVSYEDNFQYVEKLLLEDTTDVLLEDLSYIPLE